MILSMKWLMLITLLIDGNSGSCQINCIIGGSLIWGDVPERDAKPKEITVGKMRHDQAHKGTDRVSWTLMNIQISVKTVKGVPYLNCLMRFVSFYIHLYYIWITFVEIYIGVSIQISYIGNLYMNYVFVGWRDWSVGLRVLFSPTKGWSDWSVGLRLLFFHNIGMKWLECWTTGFLLPQPKDEVIGVLDYGSFFPQTYMLSMWLDWMMWT